jgi:hypothetical protein
MKQLQSFKERLVTPGAEPLGMTPDQFEQWVKTGIPTITKVVKDEKITVE